MTAPATVGVVAPGVLRIVIHEGRNRQIRRMAEAVGHPVRRLVRTRIGPLTERGLGPGEWRPLTLTEVRDLAAAAGPPPGSPPRRRDARPARAGRRPAGGRSVACGCHGPRRPSPARGHHRRRRHARKQITERVQELLRELFDRNGVDHDDLISIVFTATGDLVSVFPAAAARAMGLGDVPLLCARELDIVGSTPRCLRVLVHVTTEKARARPPPRLPPRGPVAAR